MRPLSEPVRTRRNSDDLTDVNTNKSTLHIDYKIKENVPEPLM